MTDSLPDDLVDRARSLAPLIEAHADQTETEGTMPAPVVEAIAESGLFLTLVPRELGGLEADIATTLAVFEELARADGSTGWSTMANITTAGLASIYTGDEAVKTMFADPDVVMAGMLGPVGSGTAVDGGFRVSGHFQFGSGSGHASWMGAGFIEMDGDEPAVTAAGLPAMRIAFMPRQQVAMQGNWDVLGLAGTGSYDYEVDEVVVADDFTVLLLEAERRRGGRPYDIGFFGLVACGHAGFALGVGRRALDEIIEVARAKVRLGAEPDRRPAAVPARLRHGRRGHGRGPHLRLRHLRRGRARRRGRGCPVARAGPADAPGDHLRHPGGGRRRPFRLHLGRIGRPAQSERDPALLP